MTLRDCPSALRQKSRELVLQRLGYAATPTFRKWIATRRRGNVRLAFDLHCVLLRLHLLIRTSSRAGYAGASAGVNGLSMCLSEDRYGSAGGSLRFESGYPAGGCSRCDGV